MNAFRRWLLRVAFPEIGCAKHKQTPTHVQHREMSVGFPGSAPTPMTIVLARCPECNDVCTFTLPGTWSLEELTGVPGPDSSQQRKPDETMDQFLDRMLKEQQAKLNQGGAQ